MNKNKLEEIRKEKNYLDVKGASVKAKKDGVYTITASTPDMDRDGEVIVPGAFKSSLVAYLKTNPVILWMHDMWTPPIARAVDGRIGKTFELDIEFAKTEFAQEIKQLVDDGVLNTVSIGGLVKDFEYNEEGTKIITDLELWEVSVVTVPSNRSAVISRAKVAGLNSIYAKVAEDKEATEQESKSESTEVAKVKKGKSRKEKMLMLANKYRRSV